MPDKAGIVLALILIPLLASLCTCAARDVEVRARGQMEYGFGVGSR